MRDPTDSPPVACEHLSHGALVPAGTGASERTQLMARTDASAWKSK